MSNTFISSDSQSTSEVNGRILTALADDVYSLITYDEDKVVVTVGKNGNTIVQVLPAGKKITLAYRVLSGSDDDKFLNSLMIKQDSGEFNVLEGSSSKIGQDGAGNTVTITYSLSTGVFKKGIDSTMSSTDNKDVAVAVYEFIYASCVRTVG